LRATCSEAAAVEKDDGPRDSIYHLQLARVARLKADATDDPDLARRLREAAIRHERKARRLQNPSQPPSVI
jgi:hypothetical protein